jgi:hypothetical protein
LIDLSGFNDESMSVVFFDCQIKTPPLGDRGRVLLLGRETEDTNYFPRADPCSHTNDLLSARSVTLEPQKLIAKNGTPPDRRRAGGLGPHHTARSNWYSPGMTGG